MFFSKFQRVNVLLWVLCGFLLLPLTAAAQEVHVLLVIMDSDPDIGYSVKMDSQNMKEMLRDVDDVYDTNIKTLYSSAGQTTIANIKDEIRALRPGRDDVVLFYFAGHGGMMSQADRRTYLLVSEPKAPNKLDMLLRSDLEAEIEKHSCRLKLIITDCCSSAPASSDSEREIDFTGTDTVESGVIRNLFAEHTGLLHVNGATEGQKGFSSSATDGGIFTDAFIDAISQDSDVNEDGFVEWGEVFTVARKQTGERWEQLFEGDPPDDPQATRQTPKAYSLPQNSKNKYTELLAALWDLHASRSGVDVSLKTDKYTYRKKDSVIFTLQAEEDCYVLLLNWSPKGALTQLFPNKFDENNRLRAGKTYTLPPQDAGYRFFVDTQGRERVKMLVVTDKRVSDKISKVLSYSENPNNPYRGQALMEMGTEGIITTDSVSDLVKLEEEIAKILEGLDPDEWGEARIQANVK